MHPVLSGAASYHDLLALEDDSLPYEFASIFPASSWRERLLSRKKFKLLKRIDEKLRKVLHPGERVYFLSSGSTASLLEQYFIGWAMHYINRKAVILTTQRILMMQIDSRRRPRELLSQIMYEDVVQVSRTLFGNTRLKLEDTKTLVFTHVPKADRTSIAAVVERIRKTRSRGTGALGVDNLCPHCYETVAGMPHQCPHCGGGFKSPLRASLLSLLFPGLGDFYLGHWKLALPEFLFFVFLWLSVIAALIAPDPRYLPPTVFDFLRVFLIMVVFFHGFDALVTQYIARRGLYPEKGDRPAGISAAR